MEFNLIGDASFAGGLTDGVLGNQVGVDPLLDELADNGGATFTYALLPGSPAIDTGDPDITFDPNEFERQRSPSNPIWLPVTDSPYRMRALENMLLSHFAHFA